MAVTIINTENQIFSAKTAAFYDQRKMKIFFTIGGNERGEMEFYSNSIEPGLIKQLLKDMLYTLEQGKLFRVIGDK